jgi:hypothetical protein
MRRKRWPVDGPQAECVKIEQAKAIANARHPQLPRIYAVDRQAKCIKIEKATAIADARDADQIAISSVVHQERAHRPPTRLRFRPKK